MKTMTNYRSICICILCLDSIRLLILIVRATWTVGSLKLKFIRYADGFAFSLKSRIYLIFVDVQWMCTRLFRPASSTHTHIHRKQWPLIRKVWTYSATVFNVNANDPFGNREKFNFITFSYMYVYITRTKYTHLFRMYFSSRRWIAVRAITTKMHPHTHTHVFKCHLIECANWSSSGSYSELIDSTGPLVKKKTWTEKHFPSW